MNVFGWRLHCGKQDGRSSCAESSKEVGWEDFFDTVPRWDTVWRYQDEIFVGN